MQCTKWNVLNAAMHNCNPARVVVLHCIASVVNSEVPTRGQMQIICFDYSSAPLPISILFSPMCLK